MSVELNSCSWEMMSPVPMIILKHVRKQGQDFLIRNVKVKKNVNVAKVLKNNVTVKYKLLLGSGDTGL